MMLDDDAIARLREAATEPDLGGTPYTLIERLAVGGMGTIYRVRDARLARDVALKVLSDGDPSGEMTARLLAEARHLARLEHPNIVPVHDAGTLPDGRPWYAMKLVRGVPLTEWRALSQARPAMLRLFQKICEAVAFAHAHGVLHRDLKPDNIMVGSFGEALVLDWGVALDLSAGESVTGTVPLSNPAASGMATMASRLTQQGAIIGTPSYMSPEQATGATDRLDRRADVYALGGILYFLLSGRAPFAGATVREILDQVTAGALTPLRQIDPSIPRPLASICSRAMALAPDDRYASALELADDIARHLDGLPVAAHREMFFERARRLAARNRVMIFLIGAYLLIRMAILVMYRR